MNIIIMSNPKVFFQPDDVTIISRFFVLLHDHELLAHKSLGHFCAQTRSLLLVIFYFRFRFLVLSLFLPSLLLHRCIRLHHIFHIRLLPIFLFCCFLGGEGGGAGFSILRITTSRATPLSLLRVVSLICYI